jgi:signal transduction histidine kinase
MTTMVGDLLEYARTQLGGKLPITRHLADIEEICISALADAKAAHPNCTFELETSGDLLDDFDGPRLQQVLSNLLNNAAKFRSNDSPVTIIARGELKATIVQVRNFGPVVPVESIEDIFNPLVQLHGETGPSTSIGLGLFIAREITVAHGGSIAVESNASSGTTFTVKFPRMHAQ